MSATAGQPHHSQQRTASAVLLPRTVRRAEAFIVEHACEPLTLADIANAAGVPVRTLLHSFRRFRNVSPGIADIRRKYSMAEMAADDVIFSATGVTSGSLLEGVQFHGEFAETETVVMRSKTGTVRRIKTTFRDIGTRFTV